MSIERIIDVVNKNNFGVLFQDTKTIERFQNLSGMEGAYKVEYQHHYINLVGRIEADGQILDIAIPMALYNYHQEVSGASVEFNLGEVGKANDIAMKTAIEKFNEFETTEMYKELVDFGITDWQLVGLNSVHAHPTGVNGFSGTDLRTDIKHPGVNFPLSEGKSIPNFASILQHRESYAEIIHTEYRIFNGVVGGERHYAKGRCLTINRGFESDVAEEAEEIPAGVIDLIFGTIRPQAPKPKPEKDRKDFVLQNQFADATIDKVKLFSDEMMKLWKECEFEPDLSNVLKTNVVRGRGRLQKTTTWGGTQGKFQGRNRNSLEEENEGLFGEWYDKYSIKNEKPKQADDSEPSYVEAIAFLVANGYEERDLRMNYSYKDMVDEYWETKLNLLEEEPPDWVRRQQYSFGEEVTYEDEIYRMKNEKNDIISVTAPDIAVGIWELVEDGVIGSDFQGNIEDKEMIDQLEGMNIMTREKLEMLSSIDLSILHDEIFS